ncbi:MAG TPA: tetratricopeptide repeat protein [Steroidobacteraceae bacterium]|jgi:tetratricopeptide (TPR) repeat protein|nr:tetratricopeptide repeat protein [Steroidobacteraceae bacterium]
MASYSVRDVERLLRLSPTATRRLIKAGFVQPTRGARREYRFSFQDLIVLRTARALIEAKIPARRIHRALENLRRELPQSLPLSGLSISAVGDHVVVRDGDSHRQVDSGQYLLGLDVSVSNGVLQVVEHRREPEPAPTAPVEDWFARALTLETSDSGAALTAWRHAVDADPRNAAAWINWGRLLHEQGETQRAADVYRRGLAQVGPEPLLLFNQGVLLEDLGDAAGALAAYRGALENDPDLADCHYNLARLYESLGQEQQAIRHLGRYRRLLGADSH